MRFDYGVIGARLWIPRGFQGWECATGYLKGHGLRAAASVASSDRRWHPQRKAKKRIAPARHLPGHHSSFLERKDVAYRSIETRRFTAAALGCDGPAPTTNHATLTFPFSLAKMDVPKIGDPP
jgi:hypothetical protein